jgi:hypothetical protein
MSESGQSTPDALAILKQIQSTLSSIQKDYHTLAQSVDIINGRINVLSGVKEVHDKAKGAREIPRAANGSSGVDVHQIPVEVTKGDGPRREDEAKSHEEEAGPRTQVNHSSAISRIVLTTYPGQSGIDPLGMNWGHVDPLQRGPVVVSRNHSTIRRRNGRFLFYMLATKLIISQLLVHMVALIPSIMP